MNEPIHLVNIKRRYGDGEEEGLLDDNESGNVRYMERHRGQFKSSTGFLKKIFFGISLSVIGLGLVFLVLLLLKLLDNGDYNKISIENYVNVVAKHSKNDNLNIANGALLTPLLVERVVGTESHQKVQKFILNHFNGLQWDVEKDNFEATTPLGMKNFTNYVFTKNPKAEKRIVLAAHYDSKYFKDQVFIGATDSAAPCAILMDIAENLNFALENRDKKIFSEGGEEAIKKSVTLQMIFFDGEEAFEEWTNTDSIYGARHLADKWTTEHINDQSSITKIQSIEVFVLLDLLGAKNPVFTNYYKSSEAYYNSLSEVENILTDQKLLTASSVINNNSYFYKSEGLIGSSKLFIDDDHKPFLRKNVPILHIIPYPFPNVWHKIDDNADALDEDTIKDLSMIFKLFVVKQLKLNNY